MNLGPITQAVKDAKWRERAGSWDDPGVSTNLILSNPSYTYRVSIHENPG